MPTDSGGAAEAAGSVMPLLLCTFMIVSMQLGFAMLEVGCVRQEHRMTVLAKNLLDTMVSSLSFSLGCEIFQPSIVKQDGVVENHLIFLHWAFLSTSVTICSGSMAERAHLAAYLCYAVLMSGLAYPILADSVWGDGTGAGFLYHQFHPSGGHSYYDYAGGGVIHLAGAMAALAGNLLLGRRILRPPPKDLSHTQGDDTAQLKEAIQETWQRRFDRAEDDEKEFRPNSYLQVMGVLNLWVGCYGFNSSPAFVRRDPHRVDIASLSAWNTTLAAGAGACGTFLHSCIFHKNMQLGFICNGLLSGLVCLTVACDILTPAATLLLGFLCGFLVYPAGSYALKKMRIDDPADAIPVHGGSAIFGILSVAFCTPSCDTESGSAYGHHVFCADHHTIGGQLLVQLLGVGTILVWISCVIFPVWAIFLVSEFVYALELEQLSDTYERAACHVDLEAARLSLEEDFWTGAARNSRITRHLLRQHGWNWIGSPFKDAAAASDFRQDMVEAIHSSKTALEMDGVAVRLLHGIARQFAQFRCFRELARIRLRIAPFAELSGLGAMAGTGKEVAEIIREVLEIVTDSHGEERKGGMPLQLQVEQLRRQVQNQGVLLQRLSRNKRYAGYRSLTPRLASVTEAEAEQPVPAPAERADLARAATERSNSPKAPSTDATRGPRHEQPMLPIGSPRGRPLQREETGDLAQLHATNRSQTPEERPLRREVTSRSLQSASTVSDKSMGLITPRSEGDETPPPTMYGCVHGGYRQRRSTVSSGQREEVALQVMATQLANLLQAQQRLASSLPDLRNEDFHRQLVAALERRESASSARSGSERSSRFEATPCPETGAAL